jgi:hypothetical protein
VDRVSVSDDALSESSQLWRVKKFAEWADLDMPAAYRQIALGRVPGVIRFGKSIRIDPAVAIPALLERAAR